MHALLWLEWMSVVEAEVQLPARKAGSVRNVLCTPVHYLDVCFPSPGLSQPKTESVVESQTSSRTNRRTRSVVCTDRSPQGGTARGTRTTSLADRGAAPMTEHCSPSKPGLDGFECNICLETASEPIVTMCGHLYCWGCINKWLEMQECPACPMCKAAISRERMLPIYGRGRPHFDPRFCASVTESSSIPTRPPAASRAPAATPASEGAAGGSSAAAVAASAVAASAPSAAAATESRFDVMEELFGLRVVYQVASHPAPQARSALSSEEQQQAALSRLLLLLGLFVMVCLLMF